jgi:hypothetical protein
VCVERHLVDDPRPVGPPYADVAGHDAARLTDPDAAGVTAKPLHRLAAHTTVGARQQRRTLVMQVLQPCQIGICRRPYPHHASLACVDVSS